MIIVKNYQPRNVKVQAIQVTEQNYEAVAAWAEGYFPHQMHYPTTLDNGAQPVFKMKVDGGHLWVYVYDYVIRNVRGEYMVYSPDMFRDRYDPVE